jgi:ssDNA-binding Zn-finger/Zn-ribbon topoisomerase 1
MLKLRLTHKRAKRWGRRAKPDGSCVPKLKRVKVTKLIPYCKWGRWIGFVFLMLFIQGSIAVSIYLWLVQNSIPDLLGFPVTINTVLGVAVGAALLKLLFYLWMLLYGIYMGKASGRLKRRAVARRCYLCPRCSYDLSQRTDDTHPCPECGQRISRRECIRLWARFCR